MRLLALGILDLDRDLSRGRDLVWKTKQPPRSEIRRALEQFDGITSHLCADLWHSVHA